jgi:hypothetical protein
MIKPIILYGSEIWGIFRTDSANCRKNVTNIFDKIYENNVSDKSNIKFCKFILGVHSKTSNIACMSELGRFPIYFNIISSIICYLHRLFHCNSTLLEEAFLSNIDLHKNKINTWYSTVTFLLEKLDLNESYCQKYSLRKLKALIYSKLRENFLNEWYNQKDNSSGKLDTFFSFKTSFRKEAYLELDKFELRKTICKFRISAHALKIETDRHKKNYVERSQRICGSCQQHQTEDELHFLLECPLYQSLRQEYLSRVILYCPNFSILDNKAQFNWLMNNENKSILEGLGTYLIHSFNLRNTCTKTILS